MPEAKKGSPSDLNEREAFTSRLLSKDALAMAENTNYEEIGCVGYQPAFNRLDAVVYIKQPVGYGGDVCSAGTPEYVRFFVSYDGGASWVDEGVTSFTAYNIPEAATKRLEYAVHVEISPKKKICFLHNLVIARAILSWNLEPPAGDENFHPPWGNVHDTVIQIDPLKLIPIPDLFLAADIKLSPEIAEAIDLSGAVPAAEAKALTIGQLKELYADKVEPHRFGYATALKLKKDPVYAASLKAGVGGAIPGLEIDWEAVIEALGAPTGNTSYEELECVGLDPNTSELVATFRIKRPSGFSGGPCTQGSIEYVTFWGDFNNDGNFEQCLGTASVRVYDFDDIPDTGLEYSVFLPVNLNPYRQPCQDGARLAGIRATLSWNSPHPCGSPNDAPFWGNAEDTVIQIPAGPKLEPGDWFRPFLYTVCSVNVCAIDQGTGEATGDKPFGGNLWITGEFPIGPAIALPNRFKYRVRVRPLPGGSWQTVDNAFSIWVTEGAGVGPASTHKILQEVDSNGYYTYREFGTPISGNWRRVTGPNRALALWKSGGETGKWQIMIEGKDTWTNTDYAAGIQNCPDGTWRQSVIVKLDQVQPDVALAITGYERGGTLHSAADCDTFQVGDIIHGTYSVTDQHFRSLRMSILPASAANGVQVDPRTRTYYAPDFVPTAGESGNWTLNTGAHNLPSGTPVGPMDACGYVVLLEAWDRTIASCDADGWYNRTSVGFCLEE